MARDKTPTRTGGGGGGGGTPGLGALLGNVVRPGRISLRGNR